MRNVQQRPEQNGTHAKLDSIISIGRMPHIRFSVFGATCPLEGVIIKLRNKIDPIELSIPFTARQKGNRLLVKTSFDPKEHPFREIYWEVFAVFGRGESRVLVPIKIGANQRRLLYFRNSQWRLDGNKVLFTHISQGGFLSFVYRDYHPETDTYAFRAKEIAALIVYTASRPYWNRKRLWLVFEKFCKNAQDNGFYFFEYCMGLPESERGHIRYVMDKAQPDYAQVQPYDAQVVQFLSFKHLLYCLAADIYIGSDSKMHLYVWRSKPSLVRHMVSRHKLFFLQHGVTALKQVDGLFGKGGSNPVTYFLTTSQREHDIVESRFGYQDPYAPILGFSRWDALEDLSDAAKPTILLMPTWRPWLEEQDDGVFLDSAYYREYSSLIRSPELVDFLERHDAVLKFFIHPKLSERLHNFHVDSDRIVLVPQGSVPLNRLLMECSMLVTDYSSVCWDALYMRKPVSFYQFDLDVYEEKVGSYIDLRTDLPGDTCATIDELVASLDAYASRNFALAPEHDKTAVEWFAQRDKSNRKRTYDFIVSQGF